jgi:hypothetical protein
MIGAGGIGAVALHPARQICNPGPLFRRSAGFVRMSPFTRSAFGTIGFPRQGAIMAEGAGLVDAGRLVTALTATDTGLTRATLAAAHGAMASVGPSAHAIIR